MARDWPRLEAQTRLAVKKEKVLADVRKKVKQVEKQLEKTLKPTLENTDLSHATASKHLVGHLDPALQQLAQQENHTTSLSAQLTSELEANSSTLTELIDKINGKDPLQRLDRILNETRQRAVLRASVESPSLGGKIQRLQQTGQEQRGRLALFEDDLRDAGQERDRTSPSPWFMMQTHF
ncbi:hypothetical protein NHX12_027406 [Muraenolepis orangiensis]|uniref:Uncharacterized protein n=1 Tax=Muraenolepis orangiensis TaxID=630683 RepID=A0A9Q0EDI9_9TELE|nr:hypothetical protein NHX12_027406 [Muraenolepis orangiensis]